MPAQSKEQQKFFGMVQAYQSGKLSDDKVSKSIKRVANTISPEEAKKYATTSHANLKETLYKIASSPAYTEQLIREAAENKMPVNIKGDYIDSYTARMIITAIENLNENQRTELLSLSVPKIVSATYKLLTI